MRAEEFGKPQLLLGQIQQRLVFFRRQAGGYGVLELPGLVEGDNPAVAGTSQRPGAVYDLLQDGVQIQALIDAKAGLNQPGQAVPENLYLWVVLVGFGQRLTSYG